jgi:uncharacterized protein (TIGR02246 family)
MPAEACQNRPVTDEAAVTAVRELYPRMLAGWNARSAEDMAAVFAEDGEVIGFDGSQHSGREGIAADMRRIFADHSTATYVARVKDVRLLNADTALLTADVGMVPPGGSDINPQANAIQTVVASRSDGQWRAVHLQNTPAQFHGRPELVERMTEELRQVLRTGATGA